MAAGNGFSAYADTAMIKTFIALAAGKFQDAGGGSNWVGLATGNCTVATKAIATGVEWLVSSDTTYARQAMGAAGIGWTVVAWASTGTVMNNTNAIAFPGVATNAQTLGSVCFFDAITVGNMTWFMDIASPGGVGLTIVVNFIAAVDIIFTLL